MPFDPQSDYIRVTLAQFRPTKGDVSGNASRIRTVVERSARTGRDLVVFPETVLSGYFVEGGVEEVSRTPEQVIRALGTPPPDAPDVVLGFYEAAPGTVHNAAMYVTPDGNSWRAVHLHRKVFLPTYGVFDEARFVSPGREFRAFDTRFGPMGLLVCEDMFHTLPPTILCLDGAELLLCLSATPARDFHPRQDSEEGSLPGNLHRWDHLGRAIALEHGAPLLVSHLAGSEGGKILAGGSVGYGPGGRILVRGPFFREATVALTVDRREVARSRIRSPLLKDLRLLRPHLERALALAGRDEAGRRSGSGAGVPGSGPSAQTEPQDRSAPGRGGAPNGQAAQDAAAEASRRRARPRRPDPRDRSVLELDWALTEEALVSFLQDEIQHRRRFQDVAVGVSGGVDSAVSLLLAVRALGAKHVHAFLLPYATSSDESLEHGRMVAEEAGVVARTIPITSAVDAYVDGEEPGLSDRRRGNLAARFRAMVLWDQAARLQALVLGTGNKSERLMGYFTWHADDSPPVNPLGDLFKTQVLGLARHLGVPDEIIRKPASADLVRGLHDEAELGVTYKAADLILYWLLEGVTPEELVAAGFGADQVSTVRRHLQGTHWKRRLPTVAMVSSSAIGEFYLRPVDY